MKTSRSSSLRMRTHLPAVLLAPLLLLPLAQPGCGPTEEVDPREGWVEGLGGACEVQDDCFECGACRAQYGEICVDGTCWLSGEQNPEEPEGYPLVGSHLAYVELAEGVDPNTMRSAAIRVVHPEGVDGRAVTCERLLEDPLSVDEDDSLNRLRMLQPSLVLTGSDDVAVISVGHLPVGEDRVFLVRIHSQNQGRGNVLATGCAEGVEVVPSLDQNVVVQTFQVE